MTEVHNGKSYIVVERASTDLRAGDVVLHGEWDDVTERVESVEPFGGGCVLKVNTQRADDNVASFFYCGNESVQHVLVELS